MNCYWTGSIGLFTTVAFALNNRSARRYASPKQTHAAVRSFAAANTVIFFHGRPAFAGDDTLTLFDCYELIGGDRFERFDTPIWPVHFDIRGRFRAQSEV